MRLSCGRAGSAPRPGRGAAEGSARAGDPWKLRCAHVYTRAAPGERPLGAAHLQSGRRGSTADERAFKSQSSAQTRDKDLHLASAHDGLRHWRRLGTSGKG